MVRNCDLGLQGTAEANEQDIKYEARSLKHAGRMWPARAFWEAGDVFWEDSKH